MTSEIDKYQQYAAELNDAEYSYHLKLINEKIIEYLNDAHEMERNEDFDNKISDIAQVITKIKACIQESEKNGKVIFMVYHELYEMLIDIYNNNLSATDDDINAVKKNNKDIQHIIHYMYQINKNIS